jgi:hypothetical protein
MIRFSLFGCMLPVLVMASPALADGQGANSCAKNLSPAALEIYRAAAPDLRRDSNMASLLRAKVMPMVMNGDMNRTTARIAATAASFCLRDLQQQGKDERVASGGPQVPVQKGPGASAE